MAEDEVYWPAKLSASAVPRRGGVPVPVKKIKPTDRALVLERRDGRVRELLAIPEDLRVRDEQRSDDSLVAAGRAELNGETSPLGAAVLGALTASQLLYAEQSALPALAETWFETGGPVFAARVAAELAGIEVLVWPSGDVVTVCRVGRPLKTFASFSLAWHMLVRSVRARLIEQPEPTVREVVAALADYRDGPLMQRVITSYLVPEQTAWVDEDCALLSTVRAGGGQEARMLAASVTRADQLARIVGAVSLYEANFFDRTVATLLDGIGPAVAPQLDAWLDEPKQPVETKRLLLSVLSGLPTDEALGALVKRHDDKRVLPYLVTAMGRYPARALRLLASGRGLAELLRTHVLGSQELAERLLPDLPDAAAERVRRILDEVAAAVPVAPPEALPPLLRRPPWTPPKLPTWIDLNVLPPVRLRDSRGRLPAEATLHLVGMLALSRLGAPPAGWLPTREGLDRASLAEFGWTIFERWQAAGMPVQEIWALEALALTGDDSTVRRLAPVVQAWPGQSGHARAVIGLDVLAAIGSELALAHLHRIAETVKFRGLKERATEKISEIAAALSLSSEQLADRVVPDLGLDPDGSLRLDYGTRRFTVGFDEQLKPYVLNADGRRLKDLPKPGAADDPKLAPAAHKHFVALKRDVRAIAGDLIRRFEQAMLSQRRWSGAEFKTLFVEHPLAWHVTRRLVWSAAVPFRVAEDRTFADGRDERYELADAAVVVRLVHPAQLGADELAAWRQILADYSILQPFAQLDREVFRHTDLSRYIGVKTTTKQLIRLDYRGWRRVERDSPGVHRVYERPALDGSTITVEIDPGIVVSNPYAYDDQVITGVHLPELDPVTASELVRDLETLL